MSDAQAQGARHFECRELGPGTRLYIYPTEQFKTTSIRALWRGPLTEESLTRTALLPMLLRRGSESYPTMQQIASHLDSLYGAGFAVDVGKAGASHNIEFDLDLAADKFLPDEPNLLHEGLAFLAEVMLRPAREDGGFKREYVSQEAANLKHRIEGLINDKHRYAVERCLETMYEGEPYALYRYGQVDALESITPEGMAEFHQRVVAERPLDLFVLGAVDPDGVEREVREAFGPALERSDVIRVTPQEVAGERQPVPATPRSCVEALDVNQGLLVLGHRMPVRLADDAYPAAVIANAVLGGFASSKLFVNVREKASLAYFAYSRYDPLVGVLYICAGIDVGKVEEAKAIIHEQMEDLKAGRITDDELEAARKGLINGYRSRLDSAHQMIGAQATGVIAGRVRSVAEMVAGLEAATLDEIVEAAGRVELDTLYFLTDRAAHPEPSLAGGGR